MVPVLSRSREFSLFLDGTGTGTGKNWSRKKVPVLVPEKIGPEKNYRCRYRKKFWVMSHSGMVWMGWNALLLEVILVQGGYNGELGQL